MSDRDIVRALHAHLNTLSFSPVPEIAWSPDAYQPQRGQSYCMPFFRSDGDTPLSTGPIQTRTNRTYEIQCLVDERQGMDEAWKLADAVSDHYFPATGEPNSLTSGSTTIHINRKPDKDPLAARPAGFVGVAVMIRCFALI